jgi:hypothetical protein
MNRWTVVVGTPGRTWSVELQTGKSTVVGRAPGVGLQIASAGLADRHVSLLPRDEGVVVEPLRGGGDVRVNEVPASAQVVVHAGDELRLGEARLVFWFNVPTHLARPRLVSEEEFMGRLDEELRRAALARPLGVMVVSSPGLNVAARQALTRRVVDEVQKSGVVPCFGELSSELLGVLIPEVDPVQLSRLMARIPAVVGPRAVVATARAPEQGLDAESLIGACWDLLLGAPSEREEPILVDPTMVRISALLESLAEDEGAVCLVGPPGSGRRTLLEGLARAAGRRVFVCSALDLSALSRARPGDWLLVRDIDRLSAAALDTLVGQVRTRLLATASQLPRGHHFPHELEVPPLVARRDELLPLAEAFVSRARAAVGRPRLTLSAEARALLQAWRWPGNVRELANVLARAARATARDEIGRDALPLRLANEASADDFRGAMASAERELLLETLARTRWNVSAAATRLGMPRRTLVHRMGKLGLKRPAR